MARRCAPIVLSPRFFRYSSENQSQRPEPVVQELAFQNLRFPCPIGVAWRPLCNTHSRDDRNPGQKGIRSGLEAYSKRMHENNWSFSLLHGKVTYGVLTVVASLCTGTCMRLLVACSNSTCMILQEYGGVIKFNELSPLKNGAAYWGIGAIKCFTPLLAFSLAMPAPIHQFQYQASQPTNRSRECRECLLP